ncbi:coiled-coil domain-containing protein 87 [Rhinophrynus dorsalis]
MLKDMGSPYSLRMGRKHVNAMADQKLDLKKLNQLYNDKLKHLTLFPTQTPTEVEIKDHVQNRISASVDKTFVREEIHESVCKDVLFLDIETGIGRTGHQLTTTLWLLTSRIDGPPAIGDYNSHYPQPAVSNVKQEEIIISEVKVISDGIPHVLSAVLFTASERQHLHRRLVTHILIVSEQLFVHYLQRMEWNKSQSFFSEEANLTRFKAQLLLDCSKFLNVFSVRHHLITEMNELKGKELIHRDPDEILENIAFTFPGPSDERSSHIRGSNSCFTMGYFIRLGRPKVVIHKPQREIDLLQIENIKRLDLKKVCELIPGQDENSTPILTTREVLTTPCLCTHSVDQDIKEKDSHRKLTNLKKCISCPNLRIGDPMIVELGITLKSYSSECPEINCVLEKERDEGICLSEDLKRLVRNSPSPTLPQQEDQCSDEEIPPLIRAITHGGGNAARRHKMEALLEDADKKQEHDIETPKTPGELHPQAYSVDVKTPYKPLLRRADVQASHRIYTDLTEISKYLPVYNDFSSEIETASVKRLDQNLFVGQELQEVYSELIKNISTDHLKFDQDGIIEPYASSVDFSKCASSATLSRNKNQRVINKALDSIASGDLYSSEEHPMPVNKEASRTSDSWLVWWKSNVSTDDYIKFLSTQDLDYLKVIYHLYNTDSEDEKEVQLAVMKEKERQKRERDKKIAELRAQKQNYIPGMWNINSVMLGGLGRDPVVADVEHERTETLEAPYQKQINAIWDTLHIPEGQRLDMAIKYSFSEYQDLLPQAIRMWEKVAKLIQKREQLLGALEMFERTASDPNRFFWKGYGGSSMARMEESRERNKLLTQMAKIEHEILEVLHVIKKTFNDTVSFRGRPYVEKIHWDKTEMLYWLQQDRRETVLQRDTKKEDALLMLHPLN